MGTDEQQQRKQQHTEVINWQHAINAEMNFTLNSRWSFGLYLPIINNTSSSLYEHGGNSGGDSARHKTHSFGLGDVRIAAYRWLFDPAKAHKGNLQAGLGIKFLTGDYRVQDFCYKSNGSIILGPVDQSIQFSDGGTGFSGELNGFYIFSPGWGLYQFVLPAKSKRAQWGFNGSGRNTILNSCFIWQQCNECA